MIPLQELSPPVSLVGTVFDKNEQRFYSKTFNDVFHSGKRYSHYSLWRRAWEYLIMLIGMFSLMEVTFIFVVMPNISFVEYLGFFILDILFGADIYIILTTVIQVKGNPITEPEQLAKLYGKVGLWIHIISCLPLGWIGIVAHNIYAYLGLSVTKLLRFHRTYKAYRTTRTNLPYIGSFATIIPFFFFLLFAIHVFACIFLMSAKIEGYDKSWLKAFADQGFSDIKLYVVAIYFVLTTISTIGYGDISPVTNAETIVMIFVQIIGVVMHTVITSNLVAVLYDSIKSEFINHYKVAQDFLKFKKVGVNLRREVRNFLQYSLQSTGAAGGIRSILKKLPSSLRTQIKLELTNKFFSNTLAFSALNNRHLLKLAAILKHITFSPGDYLAREGEVCDCLFFIGRGLSQVIVDGQVVASQSCDDGQVIGENQMLLGSQRSASIRALTYVDAWVLKKDDLSQLLLHRSAMRHIIMQSIALAYPVVIEQIAENLLGPQAAAASLRKLRARDVAPVREDHIPTIRKPEDHTPRIDIARRQSMAIPKTARIHIISPQGAEGQPDGAKHRVVQFMTHSQSVDNRPHIPHDRISMPLDNKASFALIAEDMNLNLPPPPVPIPTDDNQDEKKTLTRRASIEVTITSDDETSSFVKPTSESKTSSFEVFVDTSSGSSSSEIPIEGEEGGLAGLSPPTNFRINHSYHPRAPGIRIGPESDVGPSERPIVTVKPRRRLSEIGQTKSSFVPLNDVELSDNTESNNSQHGGSFVPL